MKEKMFKDAKVMLNRRFVCERYWPEISEVKLRSIEQTNRSIKLPSSVHAFHKQSVSEVTFVVVMISDFGELFLRAALLVLVTSSFISNFDFCRKRYFGRQLIIIK